MCRSYINLNEKFPKNQTSASELDCLAKETLEKKSIFPMSSASWWTHTLPGIWASKEAWAYFLSLDWIVDT
jgi:hypothetical protein